MNFLGSECTRVQIGKSHMRVTAEDVARIAGVSRSAVSRAFTDGASVAPETRAHIQAIALQLGYRPNLIARGLTGGRTGLVAVVIGSVSGPFESFLLDHLSAAIRDAGLLPLLLSQSDRNLADRSVDEALRYQVDGAIVAAGSISADLAGRCAKVGVPLLMIGRLVDGIDAVLCDNAMGVEGLVARLVAQGRRRLAWIGGFAETFSERERSEVFQSALAARGLQPAGLGRGTYTVESGLAQALALLTGPEPPDAILCGNDAMAIGALAAARRLKIDVPDALAVTGFDDIPAAGWDMVRLTTARTPVPAMAAAAVARLSERIAAPDLPPEMIRISPELCLRDTG